MNTVFTDASAWIALYHKKDKHHNAAWLIYEQLLNGSVKFLTSNWVAYEAVSFIKNKAGYEAARVLWKILQDTELFQSADADKETEAQAVNIFWKYRDKKWGIVDCSSMLLMKKKNCLIIFAYDHHFIEASRQYGFKLL